MNWKQIVLALVLLDFLALTGWVVYEHGYLGFFELALANSATALLSFDLVITLALISFWMWQDASERGAHLASYLVITLLIGAAGPLLYLIVREHQLAQVGAPQTA